MNTLPVPVETGLRSLIPSTVRTLIPLIVSLLVRYGLAQSTMDTAWLENTLTVLVTAVYYVAIRLLEQHWDRIGWLLGYPKQPVYVKGEVISSTVDPVVVDAAVVNGSRGSTTGGSGAHTVE